MTYFTDSEELRALGTLFGVTDPNAGHEVIGDAITSRVETLSNALRLLVADVEQYEAWQRPCYALEVARAALRDIPTAAPTQEKTDGDR